MTHTRLNASLRGVGTLVLLALTGCAGGWRNAPAGAASVPQADAATAAAPASTGGVTFTYKGPGNAVTLVGEFNSWNTSADPMTKLADGSWMIAKKLNPGRYAYKFLVDGSNWKPDDNAKESIDDGYGGKNSIVVVPAGGAAAVPAAPSTPAAATPAAPAGNGTRFTYKGAGNTVALAGEFNSWNATSDPLAKQLDGSWTIVKPLQPGKYQYKFVVDGTNWKPDDNAKETADDGYGGKNSVVVVGGDASASTTPAPAMTAPAAAATAPAAGGSGVKFTYQGAGNSVALAGEFNSWNTTADMLTKQADGSWTIIKPLQPGKYQYKFVVDGTTWKADDAATESADDGHGGKNSVVVVAGGAPAAAPAAAAAATGAVTGKAAPPKITADGVTFTFAGAADQVALAGDFNGWSTTSDPLVHQADGTWTIVKKIPAGTYGYKFLVNGKSWKQDDANPEAKDDGFGGKNSILTVQ